MRLCRRWTTAADGSGTPSWRGGPGGLSLAPVAAVVIAVAAFAGIMAGGCAPSAEGTLDEVEPAAAASDSPAAADGSAATNDPQSATAQAASAPAKTVSSEPAPEEPDPPRILPAGTRIVTKLNDYLDSGENQVGDTFTMSVAETVYYGDDVALRVGSQIRGYVASVESARRPNKGGRLVLKADSMVVDGERIAFEGIVTADTEREGESSLKEDWKEIAAVAGIGGVVGGLIGGGKGVLAGVLVGGGGTFLATKGEQIELPPDTELIVELREPVQVSR